MNQDEVEKRIQGLQPEQATAVVCALIGHSRIVTTCMGYVHCARCNAQIGDTLAGASSTQSNVIVGHDCPTCRENIKTCTWVDTFMTPDPFDPREIEEQRKGREALDKFIREAKQRNESRTQAGNSQG